MITRTAPRHAASLIALLWAATVGQAAVADGVLAPGTRYETPYQVRDSGRPGPTVLVVGGVHGDEPAGACAAAVIAGWSRRHGRLAVLPRANLMALHAATRNLPGEPAAQANLNRCFPPEDQPDAQPQGPLATAIWTWVQALRPDWIFDLHEGYGVRGAGSQSVGSSVIHLRRPAAEALATRMVAAVNATVSDPKLQFVRLAGAVSGSLARAGGRLPGCNSMILETTSRSQPLERRVAQHLLLMRTALADLVDPETPSAAPLPPAVPAGCRVAIYRGPGIGGRGPDRLTEIAAAMPATHAWPVTAEEVQRGVLAGFDIVVLPGGTGSGQAKGLAPEGADQVRRFVRSGGGYLGVCAGAYLATAEYSWGLRLLAAHTVDSAHWRRGVGTVRAELSEAGRTIFAGAAPSFDIRYANGPLLAPFETEQLAAYTPLAWFRSELAENGAPSGVMVGATAAACGHYGRGRVLVWSPHPEATPGLEPLVTGSLRWVAGESAPPAAK